MGWWGACVEGRSMSPLSRCLASIQFFFRIQEKTKSTTTSERCLLTRSKTPFPCEYSLRMYNRLVEKCFKDCVDSFRRKNLDSNEERVREREREDLRCE